jgi:hypothetical protein
MSATSSLLSSGQHVLASVALLFVLRRVTRAVPLYDPPLFELEVFFTVLCLAFTIALTCLLRVVAGYTGSELDWWDGLFLVVWPLFFLSLLLPDERSPDGREVEEDPDMAAIRSRGRADAEAGLPPRADRYSTTSEQLAYRRGVLEHRRLLANLQGEADAAAGRPALEHNFQTIGEQCAYIQAYEKSRRKRRP